MIFGLLGSFRGRRPEKKPKSPFLSFSVVERILRLQIEAVRKCYRKIQPPQFQEFTLNVYLWLTSGRMLKMRSFQWEVPQNASQFRL